MLEIGSDVYQLNENITLRNCEQAQEYWAFNVANGDHYSLNKTSAWILSKIDGRRRLAQIRTDFVGRYDVDLGESARDFEEIIQEFISEGLINRRDS